MRIRQLSIQNFRGIKNSTLYFTDHIVLVGDNNAGKSSIMEAIDLVLGPDRVSRIAPIDEHDFYASQYIDGDGTAIPITIEAIIISLNEEQQRRFRDQLDYWDDANQVILEGPVDPEVLAREDVHEALRVKFIGEYDPDDDDFVAKTIFSKSEGGDGEPAKFGKFDKRLCGFLYLRTLRTGSRALSMERGSLLDIILRLRELRPQMWENVLNQLSEIAVAEDPALGLTDILTSIQNAIRNYVPMDWGSEPRLRVSDLTRERLRRTLTIFMTTGATRDGNPHYAPFQHQGTGTINMLVLALLSMIAEEKQTVIFAMEEPETAIPPHTQKRIVDTVRKNSNQTFFTSHSPYVLEEFSPKEILVLKRDNTGVLNSKPFSFPPRVKPKAYSSEYRKQFAEALLARRVLVAEGITEVRAYQTAARRLAELDPAHYAALEALGVAVVNAETDSQVSIYGQHFKDFGKTVFAVFDRQTDREVTAAIEAAVDIAFEAPTDGFERLVVDETAEAALRRFATEIVASGTWPSHLRAMQPTDAMALNDLKNALFEYLKWGKGIGGSAEVLAVCSVAEMPNTVKTALARIKREIEPEPPQEEENGDEENGNGEAA